LLRRCIKSRKGVVSILDGALGSTQPLTEMNTRDIFWAKMWPVSSADNLATFMC